MCDQVQVDERSDVSETDSEGWDIIRSTELQSVENTSDTDSIEIISEEETVQTSKTEQIFSDICENCVTPNEEENNVLFSPETVQVEEVTESSSLGWFYRFTSLSENINSILSEQKNVPFLYFAVVFLVIAMFMAPRDDQAKTNTTKKTLECDGLTANLINELQMYRESNAKLEKQIKELYEVINGSNKLRFISPIDQKNSGHENNSEARTITNPARNSSKFDEDMNEIVNFYKELIQFPNNTKNTNNSFQNIFNDEKYKNLPIINDILKSLYNESVESTLLLFNKIPIHLNELSNIMSLNKSTKPFIEKWGKKMSKFSKNMEEDLNRMKLRTVKHVLKGISDLTFSFYRRLCNAELNRFISFDDCYSLYIYRPWKGRYQNINGSKQKIRNVNGIEEERVNNVRKTYEENNEEKLINADNSEEIVVEDEELIYEKLPEEQFNKNYINNDNNKFIKNLKNEIETEKLQKKVNNKVNLSDPVKNDQQKNLNGMDSENLVGKNNINPNSCKNNFLKCNNTNKREKINTVDGNWFLNIGDQRSSIRKEKNKFGNSKYNKKKFRNYERYYRNYQFQTSPPTITNRIFGEIYRHLRNMYEAPFGRFN